MLFNTGKLRLLAVATTMLASMSFISAASAAGPTYALVQINQQALFFNLMNKGAQDAAKASGKDLVIFNSNDNPVAQNDAIENYIQQGVKGILVAAIDVNGIMPAVKEAAAANIPVIAIDAVLPAGPQAAQVGVDNIEGGRIIGQYFVDYVQKEMGGQARLGIVGALNSAIQNQRHGMPGFFTQLADLPSQGQQTTGKPLAVGVFLRTDADHHRQLATPVRAQLQYLAGYLLQILMIFHADPATLCDRKHRCLLHTCQRQIATDQHHGLTVSGFREVIQTQGDVMLRTMTGNIPEHQDKPQHRQQNKHRNQSG